MSVETPDLQGDVLSTHSDKERELATAQFRQDLADGLIDLGPITVPDPITEDIRDQRDPELLGAKLLELRTALPNASLSYNYDNVAKYLDVENYDPKPVDWAAGYRAELEARVLEGDIYAESMLLEGKPFDDMAGE